MNKDLIVKKRVDAVGDSWSKLVQHIRESVGELTFKHICLNHVDINIHFGSDSIPIVHITIRYMPWASIGPEPQAECEENFFCVSDSSKNGIKRVFECIENAKERIITKHKELLKPTDKQLILI